MKKLEACCGFTHGHVSVLAVFFIPVTLHEKTANDPNGRHKGLGVAAQALRQAPLKLKSRMQSSELGLTTGTYKTHHSETLTKLGLSKTVFQDFNEENELFIS